MDGIERVFSKYNIRRDTYQPLHVVPTDYQNGFGNRRECSGEQEGRDTFAPGVVDDLFCARLINCSRGHHRRSGWSTLILYRPRRRLEVH